MSSNYVMLIDLNSCSGCHACSISCKAEHRSPIGAYRHKVQSIEEGKFPHVSRIFVPTLCQHCTDAPCLDACSVSAISRTKEGIVMIDQEVCVGAGTCVEACPYGAIYLDPIEQKAVKCDFCQERLGQGEEPACVSTCPTEAIAFGSEDDPRMISLLASERFVRWEPEDTSPRVWYKGLTRETANRLNKINRLKEGM